MSNVILAILLAICAFILYNAFAPFIRKEDYPPGSSVPIWGMALLSYDRDQVGPVVAWRIAGRLVELRDEYWPQYEKIHGKKLRFPITKIVLDTEMRKPAQGSVPRGALRLNPAKNWERAFCAEMLNYYRANAIGVNHVYCDEAKSPEDKANCLTAQVLWQEI
jgi:hypothetical protein